jgi:antitoxin FitA
MAQLVVRNLEERVKAGLLRRAKRNRRSMEEEVRTILRAAVQAEGADQPRLGTRIKDRFARIGLDHEIRPVRGGRPRAASFDE